MPGKREFTILNFLLYYGAFQKCTVWLSITFLIHQYNSLIAVLIIMNSTMVVCSINVFHPKDNLVLRTQLIYAFVI